MRALVFIFVPIPSDREAHNLPVRLGPRVPFAAPSLQIVPVNGAPLSGHSALSFSEAPNDAGEARALPSDLFWTWFIDNPRASAAQHS